jgi:hypothetical protein
MIGEYVVSSTKTKSKKLNYSTISFSNKSVIIAAIGTASNIPRNHIIIPHKIIEMKITTLFIPSDLFIINGTIILFSIALIIKIIPVIINPHSNQKCVNPNKIGGIHHTIFPI